ncbi:MAG TPA: hypothetical protein VME46_10170 [Acidimicrobiales bacterium]|nr:hypothetical protein [Acidimicrobiales bacterium]
MWADGTANGEKSMTGGALAALVGQRQVAEFLWTAARKPVHAYLFVGPPGSGKLAAARAFASLVLCPGEGDDGCGTCQRVAEGKHPDVVVIEREGASLSIEQAREVTRLAARSSVEGGRVVVVVPDLHLAGDALPALLKTIEEPAGPVLFVGLAEYVPPELVTIASRCVRADFRPLTEDELSRALEAEGVAPAKAEAAASMAGGRLDRARLLANDPAAESRRQVWDAVPARLDGSGATVAVLVAELVELLKRSAEPLEARQSGEVSEAAERAAAASPVAVARPSQGPPRAPAGPGRPVQAAARSAQVLARAGAKELEERHRRELRRQRTDELRSGLAVLARAYRERAVQGQVSPAQARGAVALIDELSADLAFNPGEQLALQALFVRLDRLAQVS